MHNYVKAWLGLIAGLLLLTLSTYYGSHAVNDYYDERISYNATLVQAYEYGDRCGYKGHDTCSAWKGRFREATTGQYFSKDINGFLYQNYVEGGRKDIPSYIVLTKQDFGEEVPWYGTTLKILTLAFFVFLVTTVLLGVCIPPAIAESNLKKAQAEYKTASRRRQDELYEQYGYQVRYG